MILTTAYHCAVVDCVRCGSFLRTLLFAKRQLGLLGDHSISSVLIYEGNFISNMPVNIPLIISQIVFLLEICAE